MIAGAGDDGFVGQQVWSLDGDGESVAQSVMAGKVATYQIQVTNSEPTSDDFIITGPGSDTKWTVSYFDSQGHDITAAVTGAGYTAHGLGAGQTCNLSVEVAPTQGVADGDTKDVLVTATIGSDTAQADAVLATTTAAMQTIDKLQYSLDDGTTWHDVPQVGDPGYPLTVDQNTSVDFRAVKSDPAAAWPDGKPVWSGSDWGGEIGESSWEYFGDYSHDNNDLFRVTAECHNQVTANVRVNPRPQILVSTDYDSLLAGGQSSTLAATNIYAEVYDPDGFPMAGATVHFAAHYADGTTAGQISNNGVLADTAQTDAFGVAHLTLTSGSKLGQVTLVASTTSDNTEQTSEQAISFDAPEATVELGQWVTTDKTRQGCNVTVTFDGIPLASCPLSLDCTVTDEYGDVIPHAATAETQGGQTDENGRYSTNIVWTGTNPPPPQSGLTVDVFDLQINE